MQHLVAGALVAALLAVPSSASAATYKIKAFSDDTFGPRVLTINQGNLVKWVNRGGYHDVDINKPSDYMDTGATTKTGLMAQEYVVAGTFPFYCSVHLPDMKGTLKVKPTLSRSGSTVTVRLGSVAPTYTHTIQRRRGTSGTWTTSGTSYGQDSKSFTLSRGTWQFRAKLVKGSTSSNYSPIVSITVP